MLIRGVCLGFFFIVPIVPDYLYHLQDTTMTGDNTFKFLAKNCSNNEILKKQDYFFRHPPQFRRILRTYCNWTVDWAMNRTDYENKQRIIVLEQVEKNRVRRRDDRQILSFQENKWIGVMFASKAFVQLLTNPFVGPLTNR